jgi:hypothetical protein
MKPDLAASDFERAAARIGCDVPAIRAVTEVEAPRGAFNADDTPTILFERHIFHRLTGGRFDRVVPDLSNASPGGYGLYSAQHGRLDRAAKLDRGAALQSASWGMFQIMGFNHAAAGHPTLQGFINAMYRSAGDHLDAFVAFVLSKGLGDELRGQEWAAFARAYNGPGYAANRYDIKLAAAYDKWAAA